MSPPSNWVPSPCFWYPPYGQDCVYCGERWDLNCTIESDEPLCTSYSDLFGAWAARIPILLPGAYIIPDFGSWDITGDDGPFRAGSGRDGLVRYYLKALNGGVEPSIIPLSSYVDYCCTWLCNWMQTGALSRAWRMFYNEPNQHGPHQHPVDELLPKHLSLV